MDSMAAIKQTFFQECEEQLAEMEAGLLAIEAGESDPETVNAVFRAVHSIKGGAGAFGMEGLVRFAHTFETTLDALRSGDIAISPGLTRAMLRSSDLLSDLVRISRDGGEIDETRLQQVIDELADFGGSDPHHKTGQAEADAQSPLEVGDDMPAGVDEFGFAPIQFSLDDLVGGDAASMDAHDFEIGFSPKPELYAKANDAVRLLRELRALGEATIRCDVSDIPLLDSIDPEGAYLSWEIGLTTQADEAAIREVFEFVEFDCDLTIAEKAIMSEENAQEAVQSLLAALDEEATVDTDEAPSPEILPHAIETFSPAPVPPQFDKAAAALKQVAETVAEAKQAVAGAKQAQAAGGAQQQATIRVDLDRVDRLIDLVGELVINQSMLAQRVVEAGIARLSDVAIALDDLEQLTREIQDSVMAIRAQPVRPIFQRMSRVVREVGDMTGKSVRLVTEGENCEVDKTVIERLADPLTHMIRNAVDHGLESTQARLAAGKPEQGVVRMVAAHRSGRVVIEVSDDGGGINRAKVREIAVEKGIIAEDAQLSEAEIDDLIFAPGFSTASEISDVSGRGVGMDVVRRSIQALGGRISITSRPGKGTTFTLSLPLTLAVLDGMVVTVGDQTLVVPLTAIMETLKPRGEDIHSLGEQAKVVQMRGSFVPLIDVGRQLGYRAEEADPLAGVAVLVETENQSQSALLVDSIIGQQQVVIKSLESNYGHVDGVAAATILGDGRVAVILDVDAIVAGMRADVSRGEQANRRRNAA